MSAWLMLMLLLAPLQEKAPIQKQESRPEEPPYVEAGERQFNFYPGGKLLIAAGVPGSMKVIGWKRASVLVEMERIIRGLPAEQAKGISQQFPLQLRYTQTSATIRTAGPPSGVANIEANLTVYVPKEKTDLTIQILKGNLAIGAVNGWIEATLIEGNIVAKSLSGYFSATTKLGNVTAEMAGKRWEGYGFTAVTQKGSVDLRLPPEYSAALQLETRDGNITVDYPEQTVEGQSVPLRAIVNNKARSLSATVGDGGAPVRFLTVAGDVRLFKSQIP